MIVGFGDGAPKCCIQNRFLNTLAWLPYTVKHHQAIEVYDQLGYKAAGIAKMFESMMSRKHVFTTTWLLAQKFAAQGNGQLHDERQPEEGSRVGEKCRKAKCSLFTTKPKNTTC